ncbi:MAG: endonuclease/exonuclease/phosphatase family protein [Bacteroidetes bacterium]|nr:endonuclease/exonuclease/phosphatase family protein [Bacteroidota bacterium]
MKLIKGLLITLGLFILFMALCVAGFLGYVTLVKYKPLPVSHLKVVRSSTTSRKKVNDTFNLLTWNIGYAGLGKEMDFFYEGGTMVRPTEAQCTRYLEGILQSINSVDSADFAFLQEVDAYSHRTYKIDEVTQIEDALPGYHSVFAKNYDVPFVPVPLREPMGRVEAGQMTLSKIVPDSAIRYALPGSYSWPKRLFLLDRCFIHTQYTFPSGKTLSLINLHNSAFSDAAEARQMELEKIKKLMTDLYAKGQYVIVGGDWNQNPPKFNISLITDRNKVFAFEHVPETFKPKGWNWAVDQSKATNRNVNEAYLKGKTSATIIDFFLTSPNIKIISTNTIANGFENSDHQPVVLKVKLK